MRRFFGWAVLFCILSIFLASRVFAMTSTNYGIIFDSMNGGGIDVSTSTNFHLQDTAGEQATGFSNSTNFIDSAGYRNTSTAAAAVVVPPPPSGGGGGVGDTVAPSISDVQAINITTSTATIIWTTNENANSTLEYGLNLSYASGTVSQASYVTSHAIDVSQLAPATTYHFRVSSRDSAGNLSISGDYIFQTSPLADTVPPTIFNLLIVNITPSSARVTWTTDEPASSLVTFGKTIVYENASSSVGLTAAHSIVLDGLLSGTVYHLYVASADAAGNVATSSDVTFMTLPDTVPPANPSNFTAAPGDTLVNLSWINPPDSDFAGVRVVRKLGGYPTGPFDGTLVYSGPANSAIDTGLTNGVTYFYAAYGYDLSANYSSGALASATPNGPIVPPPVPPATTTPPTPPVPPTPVPPPPPTPPGPTPPGVTPPTPSGPTPTPPGGGVIYAIVVKYFVNGGTIEVVPNASGEIGVLAGTPITVVVPVSSLGAVPAFVRLTLGGSLYALTLSPDGSEYRATVIVPTSGVYSSIVTAGFLGGTTVSQTNTLIGQSAGQVVEQTISGPSNQGVAGASVQLYQQVNGTWQPYGPPRSTDTSGSFAFIVPSGEYYAVVSKEGYRTETTAPVSVRHNVFRETIALIRLPVIEEVPPTASLPQQIGIVVGNAARQASYVIQTIGRILQSPEVQAANALAIPTMLALAAANLATSASLFNVFAYAQYLFTQPLLLFGRRKRKQWGVIYNSLTKQPVDLAIVRLLDAQTRQVIQTRVTDHYGRYAFVVKKGSYSLEVVKPGYVFPTDHLKDRKEDANFTDLYVGQILELAQDGVINANVPLDPLEAANVPSKVVWANIGRSLRNSVAFSAIPLSMVSVAVTPGMTTAIMLLCQVGMYLVFRRLALRSHAKPWGAMMDARTRKPISGVVVRIFDKKFNKLLEMQVTDRSGKYGFFVRRNVYYVMAQKSGYQTYTSPDVNLSSQDEALVDMNVFLTST